MPAVPSHELWLPATIVLIYPGFVAATDQAARGLSAIYAIFFHIIEIKEGPYKTLKFRKG